MKKPRYKMYFIPVDNNNIITENIRTSPLLLRYAKDDNWKPECFTFCETIKKVILLEPLPQ